MEYESEILYDLMKRDGLLNPSQDNLPYESELKEKYVKDVEGAYPKLQDYRAEWLNYNKCEYIPADFPTESQTNQTSGTFQNVIPFAYERAILKGNTDENLQSVQMPVLTTSNEDGTKTNILTVNEDVELRGIGDVKDTLDCLTGEVTERIKEVVLDGSENWKLGTTKENTQVFELILSNAQNINNAIICDKLPTGASGDVEKIVYGDSTGNGSNTSIYIALLKTKASTVNQLKTYLSSNPIVVQYPLKTESTKTVDLSCINENNAECDFIPIMDTMHYQTSSDTIPPLADLTVCVEATTQNLASFVHLEGVEENE